MTNEEIIKELALYLPEAIKKIGEQIEANGCGDCAFWGREEWEEPCRRCERNCKDYWRKSETKADIPIAVLEQEPILDKIRAEIQDTGAYEQEVNGKTEFVEGITYCLNVIDKYKADAEPQESEE